MSGATGPSRPPDGPYGPGWNGAEDARWEDWGASADRPPHPKRVRNTAIGTAIIGSVLAVITVVGWLRGESDWAPTLLAVSQIGFSLTMYFEYKKLLRKEAADEGS